MLNIVNILIITKYYYINTIHTMKNNCHKTSCDGSDVKHSLVSVRLIDLAVSEAYSAFRGSLETTRSHADSIPGRQNRNCIYENIYMILNIHQTDIYIYKSDIR